MKEPLVIWDGAADDAGGAQKTQMQATLTDGSKSALQKYQELVTGSPSMAALLKYELLTGLLGPLSGVPGFVLRKQFFRSLLGRVGRNVIFGRSMTIRHPHRISVGDNVVFDDYVVLDAKGTDNRGIDIADNVIVGRSSVISCKNGNISIGAGTNIAMNCFIQSAREVVIGKNVLFAAYCYVIGGGDHRTDRTDIPIIAQGQVVRGVTIEDNCWIGAGAKIHDGVTIGRDSIIGSGAVVTKDIPPFSVAVGVPAKVIRRRKGE
jgi:acetyltransferase-like isoleucine patch superfamily enzyme